MIISEDEILEAVGHPVTISRVDSLGSGIHFAEVTGTSRGLWKHASEEDAKADLLAEIARRAKDSTTIIFRVWPETSTRADGKASGYTRMAVR